ncbi:MAG: hypothetical protein HOH19_14435 [Kordiimonadaceae bacterium]|jgi:hypothetical protein|nr:hypothetical protein [Kordiimonadaceae bacterium]MBT6033769.1 hypothetical protein [Kordiimonadaceae bacterium]
MANKNKTESILFNYKMLSIIMQVFGSFMISIGAMYSYFLVETLGIHGIIENTIPITASVLAIPAGVYICIVGKKLKKPILKDD